MVIGVTMIKVTPGKERAVYYAIKGTNGVLDIYHIFGEFDFFMVLQTEGPCKLNQLVEELLEISNVIAVRTILVGSDNCLQEYEPIKVLA